MAFDFNGTNQWMTTASAPTTTLPITMSCFFNSTSITALQALVNLVNVTTNNPYFGTFIRGDISGDPVQMIVFNGTTAQDTNTTTGYSADTWHHACAVFVSATNRTVYIDGGSSNSGSTNLTTTPNQLRIGRWVNAANVASAYLSGKIAEIGLWSADLSPAEVIALARGMKCSRVRPQSLAYYSPMVRELIDTKGALTITNNNTATVGVHPRVY